MKKIIISIAALLVLYGGCTKKERFAEPGYILKKWARAVKKLNYKVYRQCEAYPKNARVFYEMYKDRL